MLINDTAEHRIKGILDAIGGAISTYLIGRDLGQTRAQALAGALGIRNTTSLEQSYLAGKVASLIGAGDLKTMSAEEIEDWLRTNDFQLTPKEQAELKALRDDTQRWVEGRTASWKQAFNRVLARADNEWRGDLARTPVGDAQAHSTARHSALKELTHALRAETATFGHDVHRLLQTETHKYFQQGQASVWGPDDQVYKIPRPNACLECQRLHLHEDGSPCLYRMADVAGNTNVGAKSYDWEFTIGPVHPYCYCTLQSTKDGPAPGPDDDRAAQREATLKKVLPTPADTETLGRLRKAHQHEPGPTTGEAYVTYLYDAIRRLYEPNEPPGAC